MSAPQWQHDAARDDWYYFNPHENAYIYRSGRRIQRAQPVPLTRNNQTYPQARDQSSATPRNPPAINPYAVTGGGHHARGSSDVNDHITAGMSNLSMHQGHGYNPGYVQQQQAHYGYGVAGMHGYSTASVAPSTGGATVGSDYRSAAHKVEETDPRLVKLGVMARGKIRGNTGDTRKLYPEYKVRPRNTRFFVRGKVFKVLWPELLGQANDSVTVTSDNRYNESIATKIRWFIVVMEGKDFCTCIPINTYKGQGVAKKGVSKWQHAIAYSSKHEPEAMAAEAPGPQETGPMMAGIRVVPKRRGDKLHPMSRLDFGRMYTVEHNVKVYDFGDVHLDSAQRLIEQWMFVIQAGCRNNPILQTPLEDDEQEEENESDESAEEEDPAEDEEEEEEEEEEEDGEEEEEEDDDDDDDEDNRHIQPVPAPAPARRQRRVEIIDPKRKRR